MAVDPRWRENQEVARAVAGSANQLVPALARIVRSGHWREFIHPMRGLLAFDTFSAYCSDFLELSPESVQALLAQSQFAEDARNVRRMLTEEAAPLAKPGEIGNGRSRSDNITPTQRGTGAEYLLRRLKRDRPDLVHRVAVGEIRSARAAAIEAGIVKVPTGLEVLRRAWATATGVERAAFLGGIHATDR